MTAQIDPEHPRQRLLFFVAEDVDDALRGAVSRFVDDLGVRRSWLLGAPRLVDETEPPEDDESGDPAIETLGGVLELYTALPPWQLPPEIDRRHYEEVEDLVAALSDFSRREELAFELELDGTFVGAVEEGEADRLLAEGLLGEWRRQLDRSS